MLVAKKQIWISDETPDKMIMVDEIVAFDGLMVWLTMCCLTLTKGEALELRRAWIDYMENLNNGN